MNSLTSCLALTTILFITGAVTSNAIDITSDPDYGDCESIFTCMHFGEEVLFPKGNITSGFIIPSSYTADVCQFFNKLSKCISSKSAMRNPACEYNAKIANIMVGFHSEFCSPQGLQEFETLVGCANKSEVQILMYAEGALFFGCMQSIFALYNLNFTVPEETLAGIRQQILCEAIKRFMHESEYAILQQCGQEVIPGFKKIAKMYIEFITTSFNFGTCPKYMAELF